MCERTQDALDDALRKLEEALKSLAEERKRNEELNGVVDVAVSYLRSLDIPGSTQGEPGRMACRVDGLRRACPRCVSAAGSKP